MGQGSSVAKRDKKQRGKRRRLERVQRSEPPGASPGSLIIPPGLPPPAIDLIAYGPEELVETKIEDLGAILKLRGKLPLLWVNVDGLGDPEFVQQLGEAFGMHRLTLEDVVHVHQRAKVEHFEHYVFIVVRMFSLEDNQLESEQLSIVLGENFVLTFQEGKPGDVLEPVRERLRRGKGMIRTAGPDYLAYCMVDAVTDCCFPVLSRYAERLDGLEDEVMGQPYLDVIWRIHAIKRDLLTLHNAMIPQRDLAHALMRDHTPLVGDVTRLHLRDVADHSGQIIDLLTCYREMSQALIEIHLNIASNRMNEVMKVLTLVSVIFIPLTFVVGVYGMNFDPDSSPWNMPELRARYGYPGTLLAMAVVVGGMLYLFYRRGWLERRVRDPRAGDTKK